MVGSCTDNTYSLKLEISNRVIEIGDTGYLYINML